MRGLPPLSCRGCSRKCQNATVIKHSSKFKSTVCLIWLIYRKIVIGSSWVLRHFMRCLDYVYTGHHNQEGSGRTQGGVPDLPHPPPPLKYYGNKLYFYFVQPKKGTFWKENFYFYFIHSMLNARKRLWFSKEFQGASWLVSLCHIYPGSLGPVLGRGLVITSCFVNINSRVGNVALIRFSLVIPLATRGRTIQSAATWGSNIELPCWTKL